MAEGSDRIGRMLILCFVLLGAFVALSGIIPPEFAVSTKTYESNSVPLTIWHGIDLTDYAEVQEFNITTAYNITYFDIGGRNLIEDHEKTGSNDMIQLIHQYGLGLAWKEALDWYDKAGNLVSYVNVGGYAQIDSEVLDAVYAEFEDLTLRAHCEGAGAGSSRFDIETFFYFNTTDYDTPSEAWDANGLLLLLGITWDNANTALNAWNIVAMLLTFQPLDIFGASGTIATVLNTIIALPLWACIAYIAFRIITAVIPFLS